MRVSDDRYTRDRERFDLALRLIHHEARTFTIRQWTGPQRRPHPQALPQLRDGAKCARRVLRHRGKSPRQAAFFFSNPEVSFQAAQLASLFVLHGLLGGTALGIEPRYRVGSLDSGALFARRSRRTRSCMFARDHLLRARLVPAARARARRRARHRALRGVRRRAARISCRGTAAAARAAPLRDSRPRSPPKDVLRPARIDGMQERNVFAGPYLDRAGHLRADPAWLESALADPRSRVLPVWDSLNLVADAGAAAASTAHAAVLTPDAARGVSRHRRNCPAATPRPDSSRASERHGFFRLRDRVRRAAGLPGGNALCGSAHRGRTPARRRGGPSELCPSDDRLAAHAPALRAMRRARRCRRRPGTCSSARIPSVGMSNFRVSIRRSSCW